MINIEEALRLVVAHSPPLPTIEVCPIESVGMVLAEDVAADVDSPPHDKALVDGFAVRTYDIEQLGPSSGLQLIEQVIAGDVPTKTVTPGTTSQIMTGAPIPDGADAMIMVENTAVQNGLVHFEVSKLTPGQAIMPRASSFAKGDIVLKRGSLIRPIEVGLLCEVGRERVRCYRRANVAVLPTGEELVPATQLPSSGQIRNSNGPMLSSLVATCGCPVNSIDVARDNPADLREKIEQGLDSDILVLSGGVSAGVRDLVPPTLESVGVQCVFHKVSLKPGKPIWFGVREASAHRTLVFGLPGNPVSALVCFELFVTTAMRCLAGRAAHADWQPVRLASPFQTRGNRPTFWPATWQREAGRSFATPLKWQGSADILSISQADCFIYFEHCPREYHQGAKLQAIKIR